MRRIIVMCLIILSSIDSYAQPKDSVEVCVSEEGTRLFLDYKNEEYAYLSHSDVIKLDSDINPIEAYGKFKKIDDKKNYLNNSQPPLHKYHPLDISDSYGNTLQNILEGLSKSYILNYDSKNSLESFLKCYNEISVESFREDKLKYEQSVEEFYSLDPDSLCYLLSMRRDSIHYNNWVLTQPLCDSAMDFNTLITNSKGAFVLLTNYLFFKGEYVIDNRYLEEINEERYNLIVTFFEQNKEIDRTFLRQRWLQESMY